MTQSKQPILTNIMTSAEPEAKQSNSNGQQTVANTTTSVQTQPDQSNSNEQQIAANTTTSVQTQPDQSNSNGKQTAANTMTSVKTEPEQGISNEQQQEFPGWFAIDFGTSNSTVTLFDPSEVGNSGILPKEQETRLLNLLSKWLNSSAIEALPGVDPQEWKKFIGDISQSLKIEPSQLHEVFEGDSKERRLEAIRQIELCLGKSEKFRRVISKKLYQIYHEVFRIPTLESQNLIPVVLDLDRDAKEIPSELEITQFLPGLKVRMGENVKVTKNNQIAQATISKSNAEGKSISLKEIISKFHHSPKRYFGQELTFPVITEGKNQEIEVNELIQAAWSRLIELTEEYRKAERRNLAKGNFQTAVVTYPTIAPPIVRKQVKELVEGLKIRDVQTAYDEAVAVVMFFLWREFGGYLNIGVESFKTRCRREGEKWSQNVLVVDIGGGTTDIALIKLTLSDITPTFKNRKDRGLGGRYYEITPKLLGSSGHLQLGGELITLRVFRLLKVAIVDALLTAFATGKLTNDKLSDLIGTLSESFFESDRFTYKKKSLLQCIDKSHPENDSAAYKAALDNADKVLPTRWKDAPERLQTFYTLWDHAEDAKIKLGQKPAEDDSFLTFSLSEQQITELLNQVDIQIESEAFNVKVTLTREQFERAAHPVIKEAVGIATGLIDSRLNNSNDSDDNFDTEQEEIESDDNFDTEQEEIETEKVDWLILSGKTCNLDLVGREIYQEFSKSDYVLWNPERITFDPEFTKLGTSAGACYAEKMRRLKFSPEEAKPLLRKGANQLRIDVKNLFYYLPCNFKRKTQSSELLIFKAGAELYQISSEDTVAKVRTKWLGIQLINIIYRQDYEGGQQQLWGSYNGNKLCEEIKELIPAPDKEKWFEENIKIQFEVDSALNIEILICRGNAHYSIKDDKSNNRINVNEVIAKENQSTTTNQVVNQEENQSTTINQAVNQEENQSTTTNQAVNQEENQPTAIKSLFDRKRKLDWEIAINVLEAATVDNENAYHPVFKADDAQNPKKFHYSNNNAQELNGLISEPLPDFPESGEHTFYIRGTNPKTKDKVWTWIGQLSKPKITTDLPCQYRVSLDEEGILRIHVGEVPYWELQTQKEYLKQEGCVFRTKLELQPNEVDIERDPFSGIH